MSKYIFVCGGVMSGIGKGITAASIGKILQSKGYSVTNIKIDPYLNVDAGTMNPIEHGEVFVTEDGLECDQDIGNYERFTGQDMFSYNYMTAGQVYKTVIEKERNLEYGGKCVESVPHITQEIIDRVERAGKKTKSDFVITEIGGTVGEFQNSLFLEAARILNFKKPKEVIFVLVSFLPVPRMLGEMKTKPTQYAVRALNSVGIQPDFIIARAEYPLDDLRKQKIATFCNVDAEHTISAPDIKSIYKVPVNFEDEELGNKILKCFGMRSTKKDMHDWRRMIDVMENAKQDVKIGIVGKYFVSGKFTLLDSYISVIEAVKHAAWANNRNPSIQWLNAESYEEDPKNLKELDNFDAIIVPGGFGLRGIEGKIRAIEYCRKKKIPLLGLCLGMQLMTVEFSRNVCGLKDANSTEMNQKTPHPVIHIMQEQAENLKKKNMGGSMRLGAYDCKIEKGTKAFECYKSEMISERHRHRYEFNNDYRDQLAKKGLIFSGINPKRNLVEIIELKDHPFFVACQFHPEFKSAPVVGHPLFNGLIKAGISNKK
ncbi:MAG TPA: CTP synthase [Candidatus Pacearchaeota archaeon]|nr:CTP synthase [Candidatus Parcubacteria bacterium]HNZ84017.1 CTP synthase [Candidatus Pacearchaeota archaeon]HOU45905.1 CTP synthase [Candidatus Pacearchaeota archaeon]HPM08198.1 CTP synthase [Candidatus Pacearchaeota archaeon]HQI74482.1 CTP synthase [Candidatus Pacearchaeota archaeon]